MIKTIHTENVLNIAGRCPNCGHKEVKRIDSNPESRYGYIKEICTNCGRTVTWNKQLVL